MSFQRANQDDQLKLTATVQRVLCLFVCIVVAASGCARLCPLRPKSIPCQTVYHSERLIDDQPQIQRGKRRPVIDGIGWVFGIPSKILLWNHRVDNHKISETTEHAVTQYLDQNGLSTVRVRINQYHPMDDWRRLVRNDSVGAGWRYTFGAVSVLGETLIPGRIFGGDHFNPYTNTVHIYSDVPAIAIHEGGHAKDFARREWKGTYAAAYLLPIVPLYHESLATNDALAYLETNGTPSEQADAKKILYPAYGTYVGGAAGSVFPTVSAPLYYGGVIAGHAVGRYEAYQTLSRPGTNPIPTPYSAENTIAPQATGNQTLLPQATTDVSNQSLVSDGVNTPASLSTRR